ncbi:hypothetical protein C1645_875120 [Glomus cerebriforme]|uniref:Uncharacterized protein n=1 Tax=Glomus cerebriforme TaxID=658196 RepID=A0A397T6R2_9GLOM|nr:hypothetical protein C1645_875120 [Glomus cerebriforme]
MLSAKVITIITLLVASIGVILSVTAAPTTSVLFKRNGDDQTALQSDAIPVSSDGGGGTGSTDLKPYDSSDTIPSNVTEHGNHAEGDGSGL